ncbi:3-phosphoserine/phosphohydroxythreonine transaminase, partial [Candidatus Thorarchaeota archaeon]
MVLSMVDRVYNFYAGPATLPLPALKRAKEEILNWKETGMSILEISHRSKQYDELHNESISLVRELMGVPDDYKILWLQGGASGQFFMIPHNLRLPGKPMEYADTGRWSDKAIKEAKLYGDVKIVASSAQDNYKYVPKDVKFNAEAAFAHITSNNTVNGTQWHYWPEVPGDVPLACDMSSDILSREIDVKDFGVIYAGAQKNIGPAGATLVIVREDLLDRVPEDSPTLLKWKTEAA